MERKRQRHVGRTVLAVLLVLIGLIVGGSYIYLSLDHFDIAARCEADAPQKTYGGKTVYAGDTASFTLDESELYWLMHEYGMLDDLGIDGVCVDGAAIDLLDGGARVDIDATLFGFLPVPLSVETEVNNTRGSEFLLTLQSVRLGKWLQVPLSLFDRVGLETTYAFDLSEFDEGMNFRSAAVRDGEIHVELTLRKTFAERIGPDQTAEILLLYGEAETEHIRRAADASRIADAPALRAYLFESIFSSDDPVETVTHLLALSQQGLEEHYLAQLTPFEQRYLMPIVPTRVQALHTEYRAPVIEKNRAYQNLLDAVREKYKNLEIELRKKTYFDLTAQQPLSIAALSDALKLDDAACRAMLLTAIEPRKYPLSAEMPHLADIPKERGLRIGDTMESIPYDIGLIVPLEGGATAMLYYFSSGEFVIHCLPEAEVESTLAAYAAPQLLNLDLAVFGARRIVNDPPAADLAPFVVFLPYAIESAYQQ